MCSLAKDKAAKVILIRSFPIFETDSLENRLPASDHVPGVSTFPPCLARKQFAKRAKREASSLCFSMIINPEFM